MIRPHIVDVFDNIATDVNANIEGCEVEFDHGHFLEICGRLTEKDSSQEFMHKKYPLIVLIQDIEEQRGGEKFASEPNNVKILIITSTNKDYTSTDRKEKTFKPILIPIYDQLLQAMEDSREIDTQMSDFIPHGYIERYFWGREGFQGNTGLLTNDYLDCIEIDFNEIKINWISNCP